MLQTAFMVHISSPLSILLSTQFVYPSNYCLFSNQQFARS
uniref:Uncharacterized protein n=1 Tax=Rhizophora mucronata TaxID=61149 RepID=A0A2P2J3K1_RHIMU